MHFLHVFGYGHEGRDGAEGLSKIIGVEAGRDHADSAVGKGLADRCEVLSEELGLVDADDLYVGPDLQHLRSILDRLADYAVGIVGYYLHVGVTIVHRRFEYGYYLIRELCPAEAADQFFCLTREH